MQEKRPRETASWSAFVPLAFSPRLRSPLHCYLHRTSGTGVAGLTKPEWNIHRYTASTPKIYFRILKITTGYYHLQFCLLAVLIMLFWLDICCHSNLQLLSNACCSTGKLQQYCTKSVTSFPAFLIDITTRWLFISYNLPTVHQCPVLPWVSSAC